MLARMLARDFSWKCFICLKHDNVFILLLHIFFNGDRSQIPCKEF